MYRYEKEKPWVFTDEGQRAFLKFRDGAREMIRTAGAASIESLLGLPCGGVGDSFRRLAMIDRLVELEELRLVFGNGSNGSIYAPGTKWPE